MQILRTVNSMQRQARKWRRAGTPIALVPTMGYLHQGHLSLIHRARRLVGRKGKVVVSIYVNPTQFGPEEDLAKYPRDLARDRRLCRDIGVDVLFTPSDAEVYPAPGGHKFSTYVMEERLSHGMEGTSRPTHFRGVTTVVAKLFNIVQPEVAMFGQKDFQQAAIIGRMIRDLNFPIRLVVAPTMREPDGLAMSSRNKYLSPEERAQALVLWQALQHAHQTVTKKRSGLPATTLHDELAELIRQRPAARLDYIAFFDPESLDPVERVRAGTQMALAVYIGKTRLIDNARL